MKEKTIIKSRFIFSIFALAVSMVLLVASTLAWFLTGSNPTVAGTEILVSGEGISLEGASVYRNDSGEFLLAATYKDRVWTSADGESGDNALFGAILSDSEFRFDITLARVGASGNITINANLREVVIYKTTTSVDADGNLVSTTSIWTGWGEDDTIEDTSVTLLDMFYVRPVFASDYTARLSENPLVAESVIWQSGTPTITFSFYLKFLNRTLEDDYTGTRVPTVRFRAQSVFIGMINIETREVRA